MASPPSANNTLPVKPCPLAVPAEAQKPEDWDDEEDGDWEPPKVANPKCKDASGCGEWQRPTKAVSPLGRMPRANSAGCASGPCCLQGPGG
jgi:hypothetical protein